MGERTLIIAANGRVASRVAAQLNAIGEAPDVHVRDAAKARQVLVDERGQPIHRDLFVGELANDRTMRRAMFRAGIAFLSVGSSPCSATSTSGAATPVSSAAADWRPARRTGLSDCKSTYSPTCGRPGCWCPTGSNAATSHDRFLVLPHPQVAGYYAQRATDPDRWLTGMNRIQQRLEGEAPSR
jgi:hypothetical protein